MPCDSVILNEVDLQLADPAILADALAELGATNINRYDERVFFTMGRQDMTIDAGRLTGQQSAAELGRQADQIKQAYSRQTVKRAASRFGWNVQTVNGKMEITRKR